MEEILGHIVEFGARIWQADTRIRDVSSLGESGIERSGLRTVAWICGTVITLLVVAMSFFAWRNLGEVPLVFRTSSA